MDALSLTGSKQSQWKERKASLTRSQTDSNITYTIEDVPEAPGSFCYITRDGDIDIQVVLKAVHSAALRDNNVCTLRVLEVILNLIELLMDMGVLKQFLRDEALSVQTFTTIGDNNNSPSGKRGKTSVNVETPNNEEKIKPLTSHRIIMDVIFR